MSGEVYVTVINGNGPSPGSVSIRYDESGDVVLSARPWANKEVSLPAALWDRALADAESCRPKRSDAERI